MRGDLASRSIVQVLDEAKRLLKAGVKELLIVSQDTSAYSLGSQKKKQPNRFLETVCSIKSNLITLCEQLSHGRGCVLHYVYPYPHVDDLIPLMAAGRGPLLHLIFHSNTPA